MVNRNPVDRAMRLVDAEVERVRKKARASKTPPYTGAGRGDLLKKMYQEMGIRLKDLERG